VQTHPIVADTQDPETRLVGRIRKGDLDIPPYPAVFTRLNKLLATPDYSTGELRKIVAADQTLVADVLRAANSAGNSTGAAIASLERALTQIGGSGVKRLALGRTLGTWSASPGPLSSLRHKAWKDAVICAVVCQQLAARRRMDAEEAFLCGMLHDFGRLVALVAIEAMPAGDRPPVAECAPMVERVHADAGMVVAVRWKLPEVVTRMIVTHHDPNLCPPAFRAHAELVNIGDTVAELLDRTAEVRAEHLARLPGVRAGEDEFLARLLPRMCETVAAFSFAPEHSNADKRLPAAPPPPTPKVGDELPCSLTLEQVVRDSRVPFECTSIGPNTFAVHGTKLPENFLCRFVLSSQSAELDLWGNVVSCAPDGGRYRTTLKCFAQTPELRRTWQDLYSRAHAASQRRS
jgi:HD-like signal output (HDOD) protein